MRTLGFLAILTVLSIGALPGAVIAKNVSVSIPMSAVDARSDERGNYYVASFDVPAEVVGKRLDSVFLDFIVDASPTEAAVAGAAPFVSVCPLKEQFTGSSPKFEAKVSSMRPVPMGENQKVRADVTDIVKAWIANPTGNHGIVIGTLTGPKVGTVALKSEALAAGTALRLTFFYQDRFGGRISERTSN
jgi:hypothetical protein